MSWEKQKDEGKVDPPITDEPKEKEVEKTTDAEGSKDVEAKATDPEKKAPEGNSKETSEAMVPQKLIGQVAKKIREKSRGELNESQMKIKLLEEENRRLKEGITDPEPDPEDARITQKVREEFLKRQDRYGFEKYGEAYKDALLLIQEQNDPHLVSKIQGHSNPADTLMREAARIAEELELGEDPNERAKKKEEVLRTKLRKEWESEMAEKLKARDRQPTDVKSVRSAGGNEKPSNKSSWSTRLPR